MKQLALSNPSYRYLEQSFKEWLDIQGYAKHTVYNLPNHVRELLHYLEEQGINAIQQMDIQHIHRYYEKLKERSNNRKSGGLSNSHLNKHLQALRKFTDYLREVGRIELPALQLDNESPDHRLTYLTQDEVNLLFKASYEIPDPLPDMPATRLEALQSRDRAMLAVFYGCGLRRNEGEHLDTGDIYFDRKVLHVRKGKNQQERFVPLNKATSKHLQEYIYDHRPQLLQNTKSERLFLGYYGKPLGSQSLLLRLKSLQHKSGDPALMEKEIGLHTLRHSIATHLLQAGMKLESIARFLGHSSLESTQIYTHLEGITKEQPFNNLSHETGQLHEDE